ncbi:MAG: hypothetical protein E6G58_03680 [Actinobacteria bacterium]|nr:MAG: hypothetical protein E6G58_03680 [Actinomycetota bacterium]
MREHRGLAAGIAITSFALLVTLPFMIPTTIWVVIFVYAIVKAIGSAPDHADPAALLVAIVAIVTFFTLMIAVTVSFLGRAMSPKRRERAS